MGQKIHPTGFRLAVTRNWGSRWFAGNTNFADRLIEDLKNYIDGSQPLAFILG